MKRIITSLAALGLLAGVGAANACTLGNWDAVGGAPLAGGPDPVEPNNFGRYEGLCAMQALSAGDVVNTLTPADEASMIVRMYFFTAGTGSATLMTAYSDDAQTAEAFSVTYDGTNVNYVSADGGANASAPAGATGWKYFEINFLSNGTVGLWSGADDALTDPASASGTSGAATTIAATRVGAVALTGFTDFRVDSYVSRRSSAIGKLLACDANGNGAVTIADVVAGLNELSGVFQTGQPDCNENGSVSIADVVSTINNL